MILAKQPLDGSWGLLCQLASTWNKSASGCIRKVFLLLYYFIWELKPWSFSCHGKASLGFVKSTENPSAEERKNACVLSTQKVLTLDSTCAYFAVVATYLFIQVWKLPLWIVVSQEKSTGMRSLKKADLLASIWFTRWNPKTWCLQKFCLQKYIPFSYCKGHLGFIPDSQRSMEVGGGGKEEKHIHRFKVTYIVSIHASS